MSSFNAIFDSDEVKTKMNVLLKPLCEEAGEESVWTLVSLSLAVLFETNEVLRKKKHPLAEIYSGMGQILDATSVLSRLWGIKHKIEPKTFEEVNRFALKTLGQNAMFRQRQ